MEFLDKIKKNKLIIIPLLFGLLLCFFYFFTNTKKIKNDSLEYEKLSESILVGEYSLDGEPSMHREPGYPLFRAILKALNFGLKQILIIQIALFCLILYFTGLIWKELDSENYLWALWGASLSYGLAFYSSTHLSEIFCTFLITILGLKLIRSLNNPTLKDWVVLGILGALIIMTRYPYVLVPIISLFLLGFYSYKNKVAIKTIVKNALVSVFIILIVTTPWLIRNYKLFNEINIAGRSGGVLYARAWKANGSWRNIADSTLSALVGRGILFTYYPNNQSIWLEQWEDWWRNPQVVKEMWGEDPIEIDKKRKEAAFKIIFKDVDNFSKFVTWSFVDTIRFLQLPNPIPEAYGSPFEGTYGPLAKAKEINSIQLSGLFIVHIIQFIWLALIPISIYLGFRKYKLNFIPGILFLSIIVTYSISDNIPRYGVPLHPLLLSAIFMTILFPLYKKYGPKNFSFSSYSGLQ